MKIPVNILGTEYYLEPYNTKNELDVLLMHKLQNSTDYCIDEALRIFNFDYDLNNLSLKEKKLILYAYREISIGDDCSLNFKCSNCKELNSRTIYFNFNTESMNPEKDEIEELSKKYNFLDYQVNDNNIKDFIKGDYDVDDLDIQEYEKILNEIKLLNSSISFTKELECFSCEFMNYLDCSDNEFLLENLSEYTLIQIYETITSLVDFGYTKEDVHNMIPFERSIFIDAGTKLIKKKQEMQDQNQG